jgi:hypothetical protein
VIDLSVLQISGTVAGAIVGGFSGFVANSIQERRVRLGVRRNIAGALIGEITALADHIDRHYLALFRSHIAEPDAARPTAPYHFRGERDYMPIFRSLGANIGHLPSPLPRELVAWYTHLGVALERAHALHELTRRDDPALDPHVTGLAQAQEAALTELLALSKPLLERLSQL